MKRILMSIVVILMLASLPAPSSVQAGDKAFSCSNVTEIPQIECEALVALYNSTNGPGWTDNTNWLVTNTPSDWYGISLSLGHVLDLRLSSNSLIGSIPSELVNLLYLVTLRLSYNQLGGSIPPELGNLSSLKYLYLNNNQLSSSVPPQLGDLSSLKYVDLYHNQLSGSIPPELGNLSSLTTLYLDYNQLSGNIPPQLGNLSSLNYLDLYHNQLSGSIPSELGNLSNLVRLELSSNQLSGSIPLALGNLNNLMRLELSDNQLSGSIPPTLGNLSRLTNLYLDYNQLSGSIPPELGNLNNLGALFLFENQLSGSIHPALGNLNSLRWLSLEDNQLSGGIPSELGNLSSLTNLFLFNNQLSGSIPPQLENLSNLKYLYLYNNQLSGSIPPALGNLSSLTELRLDDNQLSGSIPPALGNLSSLTELNLHNNQLSGSIPPELSNLSSLTILNLDSNLLSGSIPPQLDRLGSLTGLFLGDNQLIGSIPPELSNLSSLGGLGLENNQLSGNIPPELSNLSGLVVLSLENNQLSGSIPPELGYLPNLSWVLIKNNLLSGSIPLSFLNLDLFIFYFSNTSLCEPATPEFIAWKESIYFWEGTGISCSAELAITSIEINQSIGIQKDEEQYFVAGKPTAVIVRLNQRIPDDSQVRKVDVKSGFVTVCTLSAKSFAFPTDTLEFVLSDPAQCPNWQSGLYSFEVTVNGLSSTISAEFSVSNPLRVLLVPIRVQDGLVIKDPSRDQLSSVLDYVKNVYPINPDNVHYKIITGIKVGQSSLSDNLFITELLITLGGKLNLYNYFSPGDDYDVIVGVVPSLILDGNTSGRALPEWSSALVVADGEYTYPITRKFTAMKTAAAHEIGHLFALGDEYDGSGAKFFCFINPPPKEYIDRDGQSCENSPMISYPYREGVGSLVSAIEDHPYEVLGRGLISDSFSFMGASNQEENWVSPWVYSYLYAVFKEFSTKEINPKETVRGIYASGRIGTNSSLEIDPWYEIDNMTPSVGEGDYVIEALDSSNNILASNNFTVSFIEFGDPVTDIDPAPFAVDVAFPSGTTKFQIRKGDQILGSVDVPTTLPNVQVIYPNGGESWGASDEKTISWTGSNAVAYTLFYSPDGLSWDILASNLDSNSYTFNTDAIPGGEAAVIRVIATDGIHTIEDQSDAVFTVERKMPQGFISSPQSGSTIPFGSSIYLTASAYDFEDGNLLGTQFSWSSDVDGTLGIGSFLLTDLSYGNHIVTLTITDSDGNTATSQVSIFVGSKIFLPAMLR